MKVLIVSSNRFKGGAMATPAGPAYIAGAAIAAGHDVDVVDRMFGDEGEMALEQRIRDFGPDVIALSIRYVHAVDRDEDARFRSRHLDLRGDAKAVSDCVKRVTDAPLVTGGPGFNYYGHEWLDYLDLDYGLRGEGEPSFLLYLKALEEGGDLKDVPGCVFREQGRTGEVPREFMEDQDATAFPAYELFDLERYRELGACPAVFMKRGCGFSCTYCSYGLLEGTTYRLKSPKRVVDELERVHESCGADAFFLADNIFNSPKSHAEGICRELIERDTGIGWTTDLRPYGLNVYLCRLLKEAGCTVPNLAIETGSAGMLKNMRRGYGIEHIREASHSLQRAGLPFTIDLLIGGPGETEETVSETMALVDRLPDRQGVYVTIGLVLWPQQSVLEDARRDVQLGDGTRLFDGAYYLSPALSEGFIKELVDTMEEKPGWRYWVHKPEPPPE
jgi:radical SAM superfamily enzyme YgiQ (UPF0313 family)